VKRLIIYNNEYISLFIHLIHKSRRQGDNKMKKADIGLIGLAVMGQNLVLNMLDNGYSVAVFNRKLSKVDKFVQDSHQNEKLIGTKSMEELVAALQKPRRVMLMVKAGAPVDEFIEQLLPLLETGDIIIDGGNSNYEDTIHRTAAVEAKGLYYIGTGISGGEEGARFGPPIMPGGSYAAWPLVKPIFQNIAAKVGTDQEPCCDWVGENGAGHFVKMVHNGIEYGDMQLIGEAYHVMKEGLGMSADEIGQTFAQWNNGKLDSYLIQITADIFSRKDEDGQPLVDKILTRLGKKAPANGPAFRLWSRACRSH
jgi:6-phosphogluconate dehydrogenase